MTRTFTGWPLVDHATQGATAPDVQRAILQALLHTPMTATRPAPPQHTPEPPPMWAYSQPGPQVVFVPQRRSVWPLVLLVLAVLVVVAYLWLQPSIAVVSTTPTTPPAPTRPGQSVSVGASAVPTSAPAQTQPTLAPVQPAQPPAQSISQPVEQQPQPQQVIIQIQQPSPEPTQTPVPTDTPVPPTSTPEPTATPIPTSTRLPTSTPTAHCGSDGNLYRGGEVINSTMNGGLGCGSSSGGSW